LLLIGFGMRREEKKTKKGKENQLQNRKKTVAL
jgi:hypothetical protein